MVEAGEIINVARDAIQQLLNIEFDRHVKKKKMEKINLKINNLLYALEMDTVTFV